MKWFRRFLILIVLLLITVVAVLAYFANTNGGMQRMFTFGEKYLGDGVTVESAEGKLFGPGAINKLKYENDDGVLVSLDKVDYDWRPKQLFSRAVSVDHLDISGVEIRLPETASAGTEENTEPFELSDLSIPFALDVNRLSITDINFYPPGAETPIVIDNVLLRANANEDKLSVVELQINAPQGYLKTGGTVNTSGDWPIAIKSDWQFTHPLYGKLTGSGAINGDLESLNVKHEVLGAINATLDAEVKDVTGSLSWDADLQATSEDLGVFAEGARAIPLDLQMNSKGSVEEFEANGVLSSAHEQTGPLQTNFDLIGNLNQITFRDSSVSFDNAPTDLNYKGTVELATLEADITADWSELVYPLMEAPALVQSPSGSLHFTGTPEDYKVEMNTNVLQEQTGPLDVTLEVSGTPDRLTVHTLTAQADPTSLNAVGSVDLQTQAVDVKGNWKSLRWPLTGDQLLVQSDEAEFSVTGQLDDYKVDASLGLNGPNIPSGNWQLNANGNTKSLSDLELNGQVLDGEFTTTGGVNFSPTVDWDLDIAANGINPGQQWPEHPGAVSFKSRTTGSLKDSGPEFSADILSLGGEYRDQALSGGGSVSFINGEFTANRMSARVGSASIDLNGALGDELDLQWNVGAEQLAQVLPGVTGDIALNGRLQGTTDAPILKFDVDAKEFKAGSMQIDSLSGGGTIDVSSQQESVIDIKGESLQLADFRWQELSIEGGGRAAQHALKVSLTGDAPDMSMALTGSMKDSTWSGSLDQLQVLQTTAGDWKLYEPTTITASQTKMSTGILCMTNLPAVLCADGKWADTDGVDARLAIERFNSELIGELMPPDIKIDAPLSGTIDFKMKPGSNPTAQAKFQIPEGEIQFESNGDIISAILGESSGTVDLSEKDMKANVDLALGEIGTVVAEVVIDDLYSARTLAGNITSEVQDISLAGLGSTQLRSVDGSFFSSLQLSGTVNKPRVTGDARLEGFGAQIPAQSLQLEDGNVRAVSDGTGKLNLEGSLVSGEGKLSLSGFFNTETGQMEIDLDGNNFTAANAKRQKVVLSPDINVTIDNEMISVEGELGIPSAFIAAGGDAGVIVESPDVIVIEDVAVSDESEEAEESRVSLDVTVKLGDDVRVKAGQFNGALGGELTIEQLPGNVPTGSGAIEVLSGDFLVYGQKLTMERGRVLFGGGPLDNPSLDFDVARDVATYQVKAGAKVTGTAQVPVLELTSDPQQTDANTISYILFGKPVGTGISYTIGKNITPDLYVSYGVDLFDKIQTFNMRYRVTERMALIGSSSTNNSSADVIYTIERDQDLF